MGNSKKETARSSSLEMWEHDNFLQCGVRVEHQKDGGFLLSQNEVVEELREILISGQRRKEKDNPVTTQEQTELRGLLGGLGWTCEQTGPQHSAATRLHRSRIEQATVQDMIAADRLLQQVKKESGQVIRIFSFPTEETINTDRVGRCSTAKPNRWRKCEGFSFHFLFREGLGRRGIP